MTKYEIAAQVTMAGIDGEYVTLSAQKQREIFGGYVFGKTLIHTETTGQGRVTISKSASHSNIARDTIFAIFTFEQVANAVNENRKLSIS